MNTEEIRELILKVASIHHCLENITVDVVYEGREVVSYKAKVNVNKESIFAPIGGEKILELCFTDNTVKVLIDVKLFNENYRQWYYPVEDDELVYKHCVNCNGIFKQNAPFQSYCSYYCKNIVSEFINDHGGLKLGLTKSDFPVYKETPSPELLSKYPNNVNWFKDYLINFKKEHGHLYWRVNEVSNLIKKEENRLMRWYKDGVLSQKEIEEFERIGFKWSRRERKEELEQIKQNIVSQNAH